MTGTPVHSWERLGDVAPAHLTEGRLQLHWASQIVAAVGRALVKPQADDSHASMEYLASSKILAGEPVEASPHPRAALQMTDLELRVEGALSETLSSQSLIGKTLDEGLEWMISAICSITKEEKALLEKPTEYDLPSHPIGEGRAFSGDEHAAFSALARWFANAELVLTDVAANNAFTTAVRCWPHHFDIGFLVLLEPDKDPETAKSVGVGMSPGDSTYPQPYFYVNPYPRPDVPPKADLAGGGYWHTDGFFGAILLGERVTEDGTPDAQALRVRSFIDSAIGALIRT